MIESDLIELLNDFPESFEDIDAAEERSEVFLKNGQPTDNFLEALKRDLNRLPEYQEHKLFRPSRRVTKEEERTEVRPASARDIRRTVKVKADKSKPAATKEKVSRKVEKSPMIALGGKEVSRQLLLDDRDDEDQQIERQQASTHYFQLRIAGHLKCIKSLEAKLKKKAQVVQQQEQEIARLQAKLKVANEKTAKATEEFYAQKALEEQPMLNILDAMKKRCDTAEEKFQEEMKKRLRAEERSKTWRELAEKAKARCIELEGVATHRQDSADKTGNTIKKYKLAARNLAAEVTALKAVLEQQEADMGRERKKSDDMENRCKKILSDLAATKEELSQQRLQQQDTEQRLRDAEIQLEIHIRRRDLAASQDRIRNNSNSLSRQQQEGNTEDLHSSVERKSRPSSTAIRRNANGSRLNSEQQPTSTHSIADRQRISRDGPIRSRNEEYGSLSSATASATAHMNTAALRKAVLQQHAPATSSSSSPSRHSRAEEENEPSRQISVDNLRDQRSSQKTAPTPLLTSSNDYLAPLSKSVTSSAVASGETDATATALHSDTVQLIRSIAARTLQGVAASIRRIDGEEGQEGNLSGPDSTGVSHGAIYKQARDRSHTSDPSFLSPTSSNGPKSTDRLNQLYAKVVAKN